MCILFRRLANLYYSCKYKLQHLFSSSRIACLKANKACHIIRLPLNGILSVTFSNTSFAPFPSLQSLCFTEQKETFSCRSMLRIMEKPKTIIFTGKKPFLSMRNWWKPFSLNKNRPVPAIRTPHRKITLILNTKKP